MDTKERGEWVLVPRELVEACRKMLDFADSEYVPNGAFDRIRNGLAKLVATPSAPEPAGVVAWIWEQHTRGLTFSPGTIWPTCASTIKPAISNRVRNLRPLYTRPAPQVDEAMVERACIANWKPTDMPWPPREPFASELRDGMRAALQAALRQPTPEAAAAKWNTRAASVAYGRGEVEGLVAKWRARAKIESRSVAARAIETCAAELEALLPKEPL